MRSRAVLVAIGIDWDGRRQVLGVEMANRESSTSWKFSVGAAGGSAGSSVTTRGCNAGGTASASLYGSGSRAANQRPSTTVLTESTIDCSLMAAAWTSYWRSRASCFAPFWRAQGCEAPLPFSRPSRPAAARADAKAIADHWGRGDVYGLIVSALNKTSKSLEEF